ncbi:MAG: YlmH/Sll1252 family protein [Ruminococcus sp.]|nr:YlmH/Sll1252 family protein [Ruminococcus sp.]
MSKDRFSFLGNLSDEDEIFVRRVCDIARRAEERYTPCFSHFLDSRQRSLASEVLASLKCNNYAFFGGYEDASRVKLGVFPEYEEPDTQAFDICGFTFSYRSEDKLTHRDFLGSLMSLDIKRDTIGDIIVGDGKSVVYADKNVGYLILHDIKKIGRTGVKVSEGADSAVRSTQTFTEIKGTVSSLRLDCIVALALGISREKSLNLVKNTGVSIDYRLINSPSFMIDEGQTFSIRGYGKYTFVKNCGFTRKNRVTVIIEKFD